MSSAQAKFINRRLRVDSKTNRPLDQSQGRSRGAPFRGSAFLLYTYVNVDLCLLMFNIIISVFLPIDSISPRYDF